MVGVDSQVLKAGDVGRVAVHMKILSAQPLDVCLVRSFLLAVFSKHLEELELEGYRDLELRSLPIVNHPMIHLVSSRICSSRHGQGSISICYLRWNSSC